MPQLKKSLFTFCLGLGLAAGAQSAMAYYADYCTCVLEYRACQEGNAAACRQVDHLRCFQWYDNLEDIDRCPG